MKEYTFIGGPLDGQTTIWRARTLNEKGHPYSGGRKKWKYCRDRDTYVWLPTAI